MKIKKPSEIIYAENFWALLKQQIQEGYKNLPDTERNNDPETLTKNIFQPGSEAALFQLLTGCKTSSAHALTSNALERNSLTSLLVNITIKYATLFSQEEASSHLFGLLNSSNYWHVKTSLRHSNTLSMARCTRILTIFYVIMFLIDSSEIDNIARIAIQSKLTSNINNGLMELSKKFTLIRLYHINYNRIKCNNMVSQSIRGNDVRHSLFKDEEPHLYQFSNLILSFLIEKTPLIIDYKKSIRKVGSIEKSPEVQSLSDTLRGFFSVDAYRRPKDYGAPSQILDYLIKFYDNNNIIDLLHYYTELLDIHSQGMNLFIEFQYKLQMPITPNERPPIENWALNSQNDKRLECIYHNYLVLLVLIFIYFYKKVTEALPTKVEIGQVLINLIQSEHAKQITKKESYYEREVGQAFFAIFPRQSSDPKAWLRRLFYIAKGTYDTYYKIKRSKSAASRKGAKSSQINEAVFKLQDNYVGQNLSHIYASLVGVMFGDEESRDELYNKLFRLN